MPRFMGECKWDLTSLKSPFFTVKSTDDLIRDIKQGVVELIKTADALRDRKVLEDFRLKESVCVIREGMVPNSFVAGCLVSDVVQFLAVPSEKLDESKPVEGGYIRNPGRMPVPENTIVRVLMSDGSELLDRASQLDWSTYPSSWRGSIIIAYKKA